MSERFTRVFLCDPDLGVEESPVIIRAGALLLDNQTKKTLAQFRFQNISQKTISQVKIKITPQDTIQRELDDIVISDYLDLACEPHGEFGAKKAVYLPNSSTRAFTVGVLEVVFDDGTVWTCDQPYWTSLDAESPTIKRFEATVILKEALALVAANTINSLKEAIPLFESISEFEDVEALAAECRTKLEELTEAARVEEEERKQRAKRNKKIAAITIPSIVAFAAVLALIICVIIPDIKYNKAVALMEEGSHAEAVAIFQEISKFKNCDSEIETIHEEALARAAEAYKQGNCQAAIDILSNVVYYGDKYYFYESIHGGKYKIAIKTYGATHIYLPNSVTSIERSAFEGCTSLMGITIPEGVTSIGGSAFEGCTGLTDIIIPSSVKTIDFDAFRGCTGLTSVTIPNGVTSIASSAFEGCTGLTSVTIPSGVTGIGASAFEGCTSLTSVTIPSGVTSIGYSAFENCTKLTNVKIPSSVTEIGWSAFKNCKAFTKIIIPSSVKTIDSDAFRGCDNASIFCEASSRPSDWENSSYSKWNPDNRPVVWGSTGDTYMYTFKSNGGSSVNSITSDSPITLPTPKKDGWVFIGWYDNAELSGSSLTSPYYSTQKHMLYAKWMTQEDYYAEYCDGSSGEKAKLLTRGEQQNGTLSTSSSKIYYRFTATETRSYTISARDLGSASYYLTDRIEIRLYSSPNADEYSYLKRDYGGYYSSNSASISYSMTAGTTYYISVEPYSTHATGDFTISVS